MAVDDLKYRIISRFTKINH